MKFVGRGRVIDLSVPQVMGILNVTPDSFSDGGLFYDREAAVAHAFEMIRDGASIIDVGGESTRPGAQEVEPEEELRRIIPVIERLAAESDAIISADTRKPGVARAAVEGGAAIINDTSGEASRREMDEIAADLDAAIVVMHSRGTPATMTTLTEYDDVVGDVAKFLLKRIHELEAAGIAQESIAVDPGFGFAKTPAQTMTLLNGLDRVVDLGYPVVAGTSRKSFIGKVLDLPEDERVEGTAATVAIALAKGAHIVRVHDVKEMARVVTMTHAVLSADD
ncbi:MAG: dihydropteroate synthase [Actinomycetota bacterium]